jgi:hypothetical protein
VGSIPPAGTIDFKELNPVTGPAYPPRMFSPFFVPKTAGKIDSDLPAISLAIVFGDSLLSKKSGAPVRLEGSAVRLEIVSVEFVLTGNC